MRRTSAAVLFEAGLFLRTGPAVAADRPQPPAPNISAGRSPAEIRTVLTFGGEVVKAAAELGLDPAPQVRLRAPGDPGFIWPRRISHRSWV